MLKVAGSNPTEFFLERTYIVGMHYSECLHVPVNRQHFPETFFAQSVSYLHAMNIPHYQGGVRPCNLELTQN